MKIYRTKCAELAGTNFHEVSKKAFGLYNGIRRKTKRRPYVRSAYFKKEKIFLDLFWHHLFKKKNWHDRLRRMKYFGCAIELLEKSHCEPYLSIIKAILAKRFIVSMVARRAMSYSVFRLKRIERVSRNV